MCRNIDFASLLPLNTIKNEKTSKSDIFVCAAILTHEALYFHQQTLQITSFWFCLICPNQIYQKTLTHSSTSGTTCLFDLFATFKKHLHLCKSLAGGAKRTRTDAATCKKIELLGELTPLVRIPENQRWLAASRAYKHWVISKGSTSGVPIPSPYCTKHPVTTVKGECWRIIFKVF